VLLVSSTTELLLVVQKHLVWLHLWAIAKDIPLAWALLSLLQLTYSFSSFRTQLTWPLSPMNTTPE
jgi:hypothetical protein